MAKHGPPLCIAHLDSRSIAGVEALRASSLDPTTPLVLVHPCYPGMKSGGEALILDKVTLEVPGVRPHRTGRENI
eukprot:655160-Prorocentrum_minimum.AAC.1